MKVFRDKLVDGNVVSEEIFDIAECTYSGKDMGERSITATVMWPSPIDFQMGDYVVLQMQSLVRDGGMHGDIEHFERFYIYTMPTVKKSARPMTYGKGFEHNVTFYPAQYELGCVQMRDLGNSLNSDNIIYTGFDNVTFYGGARELMNRIMLVLDEAYRDGMGDPLWSCQISPLVDETKNTSLELFPLSFSGNTVMDALLKLSDKDGINTTFFINNRTIYVGYKRPYFCRVTDGLSIDKDPKTQTFFFEYGKTSHEGVSIGYGGLFDITKTIGKETPITKLFAYGASRNINRYYCSDKLATGRFVNRLMLPSFSHDGKTDYVLSEDGIKRFGIREGSKQFEDIYPSIRYITYGDIRKVKYCIKVETNGLDRDDIDNSSYPIARVQCYAVVPCTGKDGDGTKGVNKLVQAAPPNNLAVYVHAEGKVVKVVLCGGAKATENQINKDGKVPTYDGVKPIPGACFLVHDPGFVDKHSEEHLLGRSEWFLTEREAKQKYDSNQNAINEISTHQINYTDTFWLTDLYIFESYNQDYFNREGYSAWAYPRLNSEYVIKSSDGVNVSVAQDSLLVNEIVEVEPIVVDDTSAIIEDIGVDDRQKTFDVYLRDLGFNVDEQNAFGEKVFVFNTLKFNFLDGKLAGKEFDVSGTIVDSQSSVICAYNPDGTINDDFFYINGIHNQDLARKAFNMGAIWRVRLNRSNIEEGDYSNMNMAIPNNLINAKTGDHFVLLDLYMPDIYVSAAESRLYREAKKFLEANDQGSVNYAVTLDKVRMQQIPQYALQMREGLNVRMRDNDLNITTLNRSRTIFNGELISRTSTYNTTYVGTHVIRIYYTSEHRDYWYFKKYFEEHNENKKWYDDEDSGLLNSSVVGSSNWCLIKFDESGLGGTINLNVYLTEEDNANGEIYFRENNITLRVLERIRNASGTFYSVTDQYVEFTVLSYLRNPLQPNIVSVTCKLPSGYILGHLFEDKKDTYFAAIPEYDVRHENEYDGTDYLPNYNIIDKGMTLYCPSRALIAFQQLKHYELTIEAGSKKLLRQDNGIPYFALLNDLSQESFIYIPKYSVIEEEASSKDWRRFKISFELGSEFNDTHDYYPALQYVSDNVAEYVETKLISIIESDAEGTEDLQYADFYLDTVTIKITDSSQSQEGSQPIKEISATLSEQHNASAWTTLMSRVEQTSIEGEQNSKDVETLANSSRRTNQSLLNLKNHIFDPDGKCTQNFLQTMMAQVGADSMNYQLDKTRTSFGDNGLQKYHNFTLEKDDNGKYHFIVGADDILRHFASDYMSGSTAGTWEVAGNVDVELDGTNVYFVAIKCPISGTEKATWICEPTQHKVNDSTVYWYFNWGIITPDSSGVYDIIETRGNAYMYGDNVVAGKISSLAQNSWFDLTKGEFVLGQGKNSAALSFKDGKLTIDGAVTEDNLNTLVNKAIASASIGGENLCKTSTLQNNYAIGSTIRFAELIAVNAKEKYIATYTKFDNNASSSDEWASGVCLVIAKSPSAESIERVIAFGEPFEVEGTDRHLYVAWGQYDYVSHIKGTTPSEYITSEFTQYLDGIMVQKGEIATSYQEYVQHITSSLQGNTDIQGGLIMTDLLMLKNDKKEVTAGMSGRSDDYSEGYPGDGSHSEGVVLWGGGSYVKALKQAKGLIDSLYDSLPVLLTKTGIGSRIGCVRVIDSTSVVIDGEDGNQIYINGGDTKDVRIKLIKEGDERVVITSGEIDYADVNTVTTSLEYNYDDVTHKSISSVTDGGNTAILGSIQLKSSNYNITCKCNNLRTTIGLNLNNQGSEVRDVRIKFGVYIGEKVIANVDETLGLLQTTSSYVYKNIFTPIEINDGDNLSNGDYNVAIKNVSVTCMYNNNTENMNCVVQGMKVGYGDSSSTWQDGSIIFSTSFTDRVTIGCNGIQIEGKGGLIQMLNGKDKTFVKMFGLPTSADDLEEGRLYEHTVNFDELKSAMIETLSADYFSVKTGVSDAVQSMVDKLPSKFNTVAIKVSNN